MGLLLPIHILALGYTVGSTAFHSFIASPIAIKTLPRREFGEFQGKALPIQMMTQTIAPLVIGLTAPYTISTVGLALLATSSLAGLFNIGYVNSKCIDLKNKRYAIIDGKFGGDIEKANECAEVKALNKEFGKWHGVSMLANLISIVTITAYGFVLGANLTVIP